MADRQVRQHHGDVADPFEIVDGVGVGDVQAARWFVGSGCRLCTTYGWSVQRKQFPEFP